MGKHRILRLASRRDRVIRYRELWPTDASGLTPDQERSLDLGCTVPTEDGTIVDLIAYYEVSEDERGTRALDLVS